MQISATQNEKKITLPPIDRQRHRFHSNTVTQ